VQSNPASPAIFSQTHPPSASSNPASVLLSEGVAGPGRAADQQQQQQQSQQSQQQQSQQRPMPMPMPAVPSHTVEARFRAPRRSYSDTPLPAVTSLTEPITDRHQILHMSDDACAARDELLVLLEYLRSDEVYEGLTADERRELREELERAKVLDKLEACKTFIESDQGHSCRGLRDLLTNK
jgi:hypothetical protein